LHAEMALRHPFVFGREAISCVQRRATDLRQCQAEVELENNAAVTIERPIGIFVHLFYKELADEIAGYLSNIDIPKKIYISTGSQEKKNTICRAFERHGLGSIMEIIIVPDYGTDIAPLLITFAPKFSDHDICLKIHSKRSSHNSFEFGEGWRTYLYRELMGNADRVRSIVNTMLANPDLGVLIPHHWHEIRQHIGIGLNYNEMQKILMKIGIDLLPGQEIEYPTGSMFWFRGEALAGLADLGFDWLDFGHAVEERDGTLQHGMERCILFFCAHAGKKWALLPPFPDIPQIPSDEMIRLIRDSGLFDEAYYREANPDIGEINPLDHWVNYGAQEGRDPSASFQTEFYSRMMPLHYPNPLVHYILEGQTRGWPTAPVSAIGAGTGG